MVTIDDIREVGQLGAREHLLQHAKDCPYAGHVLRKISPYFTKFFVEHGVSANQISSFSIMFGITANFTFIFGNYYLMLVGCFLYQWWNLFDLVDGEIARVTNVKTPGGKYLETINETITECGFMSCVGIGLSQILNNKVFIFWGLIFALFACLLSSFARTRDMMMELFQRTKKTYTNTKKISFAKRLYKKARLFFVVANGYLVLTVIVIFEPLFRGEFRYTFLGYDLNIISVYFLLYGFIWILRTIISSITNYRKLMRS